MADYELVTDQHHPSIYENVKYHASISNVFVYVIEIDDECNPAQLERIMNRLTDLDVNFTIKRLD